MAQMGRPKVSSRCCLAHLFPEHSAVGREEGCPASTPIPLGFRTAPEAIVKSVSSHFRSYMESQPESSRSSPKSSETPRVDFHTTTLHDSALRTHSYPRSHLTPLLRITLAQIQMISQQFMRIVFSENPDRFELRSCGPNDPVLSADLEGECVSLGITGMSQWDDGVWSAAIICIARELGVFACEWVTGEVLYITRWVSI